MFGINLGRLNPFFGVNSRELVGIDLSTNNLKIAYVRTTGNKPEIVSLLTRNIGGLSEENISKIIRNCFIDLKARSPVIVNTIPSHLVITKNIEIPSTDPKEIKEIINLQAGRHTPYSREEIIVDYVDIGVYKNNYTKILLIIVARNIIDKQLKILNNAGLKLDRVVFMPESIACFVTNMLKIDSEISPVSVIHIDDEFADFMVIFKSKIAFIRSIPVGAKHLTEEKERYQLKFSEELKRSFEAYQSEDIEKNPNMLVLTGAVEELSDLEPVLNSTLRLPIKMTPYFKNLFISNEVLKAKSLTKHVSFLNVIAPLTACQELKVNLIPEEVKLRRAFEDRGKELIKTGIFVLAIFVLIFSILLSKIYFKNAYLNNLTKKYQSLSGDAKKLEQDFARINLIKNYLLKRGYSLELLAELYNIASLDLKINNIRFDSQGKFALTGTALSMSTVFSFVDDMEKSKYFKEVKTKYTTKRKEELMDVTDFELIALLENKVN